MARGAGARPGGRMTRREQGGVSRGRAKRGGQGTAKLSRLLFFLTRVWGSFRVLWGCPGARSEYRALPGSPGQVFCPPSPPV